VCVCVLQRCAVWECGDVVLEQIVSAFLRGGFVTEITTAEITVTRTPSSAVSHYITAISDIFHCSSTTIYQGRRSIWDRGSCSPPPDILEVMSFRMSTRVSTGNYVQIPEESE